ncbi:MAG TPA: glycosyltransferase family 39 protein [Candidatus Kapabacteria bacterium]|nr:glycosyltransferase family 39 protein [Candidatus Kapabacteria bacterium]
MPRRFRFSVTSLPFTLTLCGLLLSLTFAFPFIEDNIPQAYIARMLLHGKLPYVGTWDQNYPGVLFVHLLALAFGPSAFAFHGIDLIFELGMVWALYRLASRLGGNFAGMMAALFYTMYYVLNGADDLVGQKDVFAAIALVFAAWTLLRSRMTDHANYRALVLSGLFAGFAVLIRPTYGLHLLVLATAVGFISRERPIWRVLSFLASATLPFAAFCLAYAIAGHLSDFWNATFVFTTSVYNPQPRLATLFLPVLYLGLMPMLSVVGAIVLLRLRSTRREGLLLIALLGASLASALLLWGYRYHWQPFFVFEQLLAAVGLAGLYRAFILPLLTREWLRTSVLSLSFLLILFFNFKGTTMSRLIRDTLQGAVTSREELYAHFASSAFDPVGEMRLAHYVKAHARPGDRMESFYTTVYPQYIADLEPANRFILTIPLLMRDARGGFTPMQRRWQKEYTDSLLTVRPRWFLLSDPKDTSGIGESGKLPRQMLHETFPQIEAMIHGTYHRDTTIGIWTLYARN